jgi:hypothetical protein
MSSSFVALRGSKPTGGTGRDLRFGRFFSVKLKRSPQFIAGVVGVGRGF